MMCRYIIILLYGFISALPAITIEIIDVRGLGKPEVPLEYMSTFDPKMTLGTPQIAWIGRDKLLYKRAPLYWIGDIINGNFSRIVEIEDRGRTRFTDSNPVTQADAAAIKHSKSMDESLYGFYSVQTGWIDIDQNTFHLIRLNPAFETDELGGELLFDWEHPLLGGHAIVPRPVYEQDSIALSHNIGFSLRHAGTGELSILPPGFLKFRDFGNWSFAAVSFDRFRLALTAGDIRPSEEIDEKYRGSNIFVMRVVYDGTLRVPADIRSEPSWESPVTGRLNAGTVVKVQDADIYTLTDSGEEDFWYRVESDIHTGWVFGGSLIIEGEDWRERLEDRGRPLDVNTLTADN